MFTFFVALPTVRAEGMGMASFHFAGSGGERLPLQGSVTAYEPVPGAQEGCGAVVGEAETTNRVQCSWTSRKCLMSRHVLCQSNT